jgi:hypothetical protein
MDARCGQNGPAAGMPGRPLRRLSQIKDAA